jgi:dihydroxyacetone kinase-like protein
MSRAPPPFLGYVGKGMLDGCAVGGVFRSPSSERMLEVTRAVDGCAGVLYIYGNYGGDVMNFDMAAEMAPLDEVKRVADKVSANVRTMGVALSPCIIPEVGKPTFRITEGEMEIGMGIHGEPGIGKGPLKKADEIVNEMVGASISLLRLDDEMKTLLRKPVCTPFFEQLEF